MTDKSTLCKLNDCLDKKLYHPDVGYLLLRTFLAVMVLMHGYTKVMNGTTGIENMLASAGLPAFLAFGVYIGEILAPLCMLIGLMAAPAAIIIAVNMVVAIFLAHSSQIFQTTANGGWAIELQMFFLVSAVAVALMSRSRKL